MVKNPMEEMPQAGKSPEQGEEKWEELTSKEKAYIKKEFGKNADFLISMARWEAPAEDANIYGEKHMSLVAKYQDEGGLQEKVLLTRLYGNKGEIIE